MSKKRVAYFYDEDVGNFHYGGYLNWKLGNLSLLLKFPPFICIITWIRTFLGSYLSFYWRIVCSYSCHFSTITLGVNLIPDQDENFEEKSLTKTSFLLR